MAIFDTYKRKIEIKRPGGYSPPKDPMEGYDPYKGRFEDEWFAEKPPVYGKKGDARLGQSKGDKRPDPQNPLWKKMLDQKLWQEWTKKQQTKPNFNENVKLDTSQIIDMRRDPAYGFPAPRWQKRAIEGYKPAYQGRVIGDAIEDTDFGNPIESLFYHWLYRLQEQRKSQISGKGR